MSVCVCHYDGSSRQGKAEKNINRNMKKKQRLAAPQQSETAASNQREQEEEMTSEYPLGWRSRRRGRRLKEVRGSKRVFGKEEEGQEEEHKEHEVEEEVQVQEKE